MGLFYSRSTIHVHTLVPPSRIGNPETLDIEGKVLVPVKSKRFTFLPSHEQQNSNW